MEVLYLMSFAVVLYLCYAGPTNKDVLKYLFKSCIQSKMRQAIPFLVNFAFVYLSVSGLEVRI